MPPHSNQALARPIPARSVIAICLTVAAWLVVSTAQWPFMGDATYMHYVVFLTKHGMAPYRDVVDINMPMAYLAERLQMSLFGWGAWAWRAFDLLLMAVTAAGCCSILRPLGLAAGVLAGTLFAAIHAQDGVMMAGERDLVVAVCQVISVALLLKAVPFIDRNGTQAHNLILPFASGLLAGTAVCIKPTAVTLVPVLFAYLFIQLAALGKRFIALSLTSIGLAIPFAVSLISLLETHSVGAFVAALQGVISYHAQLERKPVSFMLNHAISPIALLVVLFIVLRVASRRSHSAHDRLLALCALAGWLAYLLQGKGFSYQRYPFLLFLLLLIVSTIFVAVREPGVLGWIARATLLTAMAMAGFFTYRAAGYSHADPYLALSADLEARGGSALSGSVQCMDTAGGCIASLYQERIVQATGFLYDCYLQDPNNAVVQSLRARFEGQFQAVRPKWVVITDSVCFGMPRSFRKFDRWTYLDRELEGNYRLSLERNFTTPVRYWNRPVTPFNYRIYQRIEDR